MKNRVQLLRQQLEKEKEAIKKNKALVKEAIQKKIEVNKINQYVSIHLISESQGRLHINIKNRILETKKSLFKIKSQ